jgi:predicted metalloprotease with PDZ domain
MSLRKAFRRTSIKHCHHSRNLLVGLSCRVVACLALLLIVLPLNCAAQEDQSLKVSVKVLSLSPARLKIEGRRAGTAVNWSFLNSYAGVEGLGERIENLRLSDAGGANVAVRRLAPGEYEAASAATQFSYEVRLAAPLNPADAAHVSWLAKDYGFFALGDLLPRQDETRAPHAAPQTMLRFSLPAQWRLAANETQSADGQFMLKDTERAVFFAGPGLRERLERAGSMELAFVTAGEWAFADEEAASMAASVLKDYTERLGGAPRGRVMLMLSPFPTQVGADRWSAETRGGTVTLLSGMTPSKTAALVQLSVPLTHELFHLWIPNGVALDGNYDWFYEGFTNYEAMRAGMRLNFLTFQDYLNALGRAFDAYLSEVDRDKYSLPDASQRRWTNSNALVYHKGLLVAFLYDLQLRSQTGSKHSLDDVYRELFQRYRGTEKRADGNAAVIQVLSAQEKMRDFVRHYIESASAVELVQAVKPFGLRVEQAAGFRTHVSVADSLSRSQRDLLRKFGYNDEPPRTTRRVQRAHGPERK